MFRSILTYSLLSSLSLMVALPFFLHWGIYEYELQDIRKEVKTLFKAGLSAEELDYFEWDTLEFESVDWEEKGREFYWQGLKYDVYHIQQKEGRYLVSAWLDHEESELKQRFHQLLEKHQPKSSDKEQGFFQLLKNQLIQSSKTHLIQLVAEINFRCTDFRLSSFDIEQDSPPPRL